MSPRHQAKNTRKRRGITRWGLPTALSLAMAASLLILASGCADQAILPGIDQEELDSISWFNIRLVIMITLVQLLMLVLVLMLYYKMNRLVAKLDQISQNAGKFLRMGMTYFKKK